MNRFSDMGEVKTALARRSYIASDEIATIVFLSEELGKPLLAEGPAGVVKTELAKAIASSLGRELIRLQCHEGLDESRALYEWEYSKQLLYAQLLRDKLNDTLSQAGSLAEAADRLARAEDDSTRSTHGTSPGFAGSRGDPKPPSPQGTCAC